ncbi:MAG TPA: hypothetical protein VF520_14900 [Thermoleophilaceae bacterium]|jgi:hypothetical protein
MGDIARTTGAPQHLRALQHANRVRLARAELKRKVAAHEVTAAEVVLECPWEAASMEISDLLMSQRRWGRARCRRLLLSLGLPENKQVGTLTARQRQALAAVLTAKASSSSVLAEEALVTA